MQDVNELIIHRNQFSRRQTGEFTIDVPTDGDYGCDRCQAFQQAAGADVAGVYHRAVRLVRDQFEERTWQAFWRVVIEDHSPTEVAADMGITANAVRQAKSRVLRRLKEEMGELII